MGARPAPHFLMPAPRQSLLLPQPWLSRAGWGHPGADISSLGFPVSRGSMSQDEPRGPSTTGTAGQGRAEEPGAMRPVCFTRHTLVVARERPRPCPGLRNPLMSKAGPGPPERMWKRKAREWEESSAPSLPPGAHPTPPHRASFLLQCSHALLSPPAPCPPALHRMPPTLEGPAPLPFSPTLFRLRAELHVLLRTCPFSSPHISCQGCRNQVPQTGRLKQQKFIVSQVWSLEV